MESGGEVSGEKRASMQQGERESMGVSYDDGVKRTEVGSGLNGEVHTEVERWKRRR